ncbi:MAG: UvrD-helicase domain-containing protein [Anaerolineae bacterium]|nr:UvrD-helicase domain-containing protein [Gemmatimonadaceae bacterium]
MEPTAEQQIAIGARGGKVTLSAGAGSGKTRVLVDRFVALAEEGVSPTAILAVTYTEKAAAEMKQRIVARFTERGEHEMRRLAESAYISTIHGFCARLLRENPIAARLDPSFSVMDDLTRGIFLDEQIEAMFDDPWFRANVASFARDFDTGRPRLFELIRDCAFESREFGRAQPEEARFNLEGHVGAAMRRVNESWKVSLDAALAGLLHWRDAIRGLHVTGPTRIGLHRAMNDLLATLVPGNPISREFAAGFCANTAFTAGASANADIEEIRALIREIRVDLNRFARFDPVREERVEREQIAPLKEEIYAHAGRLRSEYERFKRENALLDYPDMQSRARELLDDPAVRDEYASRFRHILLDEAQDINDVQREIIRRLQGNGASLFAVGDMKQAIYGFRGANVSLFAATATQADCNLVLRDNFRSREEIVAFVNDLGPRLWDNDPLITFEPMRASHGYLPLGTEPRIDVRFFEKGAGDDDRSTERERIADVREREGALIARWIRELVDGTPERQPAIVFDPATAEYRPVRYGDIAILARARTPFPHYERYLAEAGIPFVRDGGRGYFEGRAVEDVVSAMRVVANALDDVALLATLRSPLFGWDDADLLRLRRAAGPDHLWRALRRGFTAQGQRSSKRAYELLARLRSASSALPPSELIEMLLDSTAYRAALLQAPRGRADLANVNKLIEFARSSTALDGPSLGKFVARVALAKDYLVEESDAALASAGDDVVVLSTIHGAKGLEWPVVILPALDTDFARPDYGSRFSAPDDALVIILKDADGKPVKLASNDVVTDAAKVREEAEGRRLFYVGLTRAREHLLLTGMTGMASHVQGGGFGRPIEWLARQLDVSSHEAGSRDVSLGNAQLRLTFVADTPTPPAHRREDGKALRAARKRVSEGQPALWQSGIAGARPDVNGDVLRILSPPTMALAGKGAATVTQLTYFFRCPLVYYFDLVLQVKEHPRGRTQRSAGELSSLELGTRVHTLLERANLHALPTEEAARLVAAEADLPEGERQRVQRLLLAVLADPLMDRVRAAVRVEREYPFYLGIDGTMVQGVIDLVFTDADGRAVVVDYKSNDLSASDRINVLAQYYQPQIELYSLAAHRAGLAEPGEATLYFLNKPESRTHSVNAARLDAVEASAAEALDRINRGAFETGPGEKCRNCGYRTRGVCEVGKRWRDTD